MRRKLKGSYILIVKLAPAQEIPVGRLGKVFFSEGFYAYVGSAMSGIEPRVSRHLRADKKLHWHIDYLLVRASVETVVLSESEERMECAIARMLAKRLQFVSNFGCTDCRCKSHLYLQSGEEELVSEIIGCLDRLSLPYEVKQLPHAAGRSG